MKIMLSLFICFYAVATLYIPQGSYKPQGGLPSGYFKGYKAVVYRDVKRTLSIWQADGCLYFTNKYGTKVVFNGMWKVEE